MIRLERRSRVDETVPLVSSPPRPAAIASQGTIFSRFLPGGLTQRLILFAILFAAEWIPTSHLIHTDLVHARGSWIVSQMLTLGVAFGCFFMALAYLRARSAVQQLSIRLQESPVELRFLYGHFAAFLVFCGLLFFTPRYNLSQLSLFAMTAVFGATASLAVALCLFAFFPQKAVAQMVRATGVSWRQSLIVGLAAWTLLQFFPVWQGNLWRPGIELSWKPATDLTFSVVHKLLQLFLSEVIANKATMSIGSPAFRVEIGDACAGLEGIGLMLVFSTAWLWFTRREFRFPHALVLIPAGIGVIWLANAVRITVLILIGVAGAPDVAVGGFHSQAGWIAFNCIALSLAAFSHRVPWVTRRAPAETSERVSAPNPTAVYLMPFLFILAAGMISQAVSGGFERLYPLRFLAAVVALWYFRRNYVELNWRFGWVSVVIGAAVFAIWIGLDVLSGSTGDNGIAAGLASTPPVVRIGWVVLRVLAACVTVPIAEELAFRGFLIRRLISADFESIGLRRYTLVSVLISSFAFGLLHGDRWIAGTLAGLFYAVAFLRRGRIGDAVAAHATTNAALAAWVLLNGKWYLW